MPIPQIANRNNVDVQMTGNSSSRYTPDSSPARISRFSLAVVCDLVEENWPSMDLVGDMLLTCLQADEFKGIDARRLRPAMSRRLSAIPFSTSRLSFNLDRVINRFWDYPRFLRRHCRDADIFHIIDHSYAQLVLELPAERTVVTCHDIDTFRCLVEPQNDARSRPFRAMVRRTVRGLRNAAIVVCPTTATRDTLLSHELVAPERLRVVPYGAHPSCSSKPDATGDLEVARLLGPAEKDDVEVLHVGSTIARKRVDILLRVFVQVRNEFSRAR